jgi:hypothetical protein
MRMLARVCLASLAILAASSLHAQNTPPTGAQNANPPVSANQPNANPAPAPAPRDVPASEIQSLPTPSQPATNTGEQWRYVFKDGMWWYYQPNNQWVYWFDNQWNNYVEGAPLPNRAYANSNQGVYQSYPSYSRRPRVNIGIGVGGYPYGYGYPYGIGPGFGYPYGSFGRPGISFGIGVY